MSQISKADKYALENLTALAKNAMRSKTILKQITSLQDRGLVEYEPFSGAANLTQAGAEAIISGAES